MKFFLSHFFIFIYFCANSAAQDIDFQWNIHQESIQDCFPTPDYNFLVSCDGTIYKLWDLNKKKYVGTIRRNENARFVGMFSIDARKGLLFSENIDAIALKKARSFLESQPQQIVALLTQKNKFTIPTSYFGLEANTSDSLQIVHFATNTTFSLGEYSYQNPNNSPDYQYFISKDFKTVAYHQRSTDSLQVVDIEMDSVIFASKGINDVLLFSDDSKFFYHTMPSPISGIQVRETKTGKLVKEIAKDSHYIANRTPAHYDIYIKAIAHKKPWFFVRINDSLYVLDTKNNAKINIKIPHEDFVYNTQKAFFSLDDAFLILEYQELYFINTATWKLENTIKLTNYNPDVSYFPFQKKIIKPSRNDFFYEIYELWDWEKQEKVIEVPNCFNANIDNISASQKWVYCQKGKDDFLWNIENPALPFSFSRNRFLSYQDTMACFCERIYQQAFYDCCNRKYLVDTSGCYREINKKEAKREIYNISFSTDERFALVQPKEQMPEIWDLEKKEKILTLKYKQENEHYIGVAKFDVQHHEIYAPNEYSAWKYDDDGNLSTLYEQSASTTYLKDGRMLDVSQQLPNRVVVKDSTAKRVFLKANNPIVSFICSPDEKYLLCVSEDSETLFSLDSYQKITTLGLSQYGDMDYTPFVTPDKNWKVWKWNNTFKFIKND